MRREGGAGAHLPQLVEEERKGPEGKGVLEHVQRDAVWRLARAVEAARVVQLDEVQQQGDEDEEVAQIERAAERDLDVRDLEELAILGEAAARLGRVPPLVAQGQLALVAPPRRLGEVDAAVELREQRRQERRGAREEHVPRRKVLRQGEGRPAPHQSNAKTI